MLRRGEGGLEKQRDLGHRRPRKRDTRIANSSQLQRMYDLATHNSRLHQATYVLDHRRHLLRLKSALRRVRAL